MSSIARLHLSMNAQHGIYGISVSQSVTYRYLSK